MDWDKIFSITKPPTISEFNKRIDLSEMPIENYGKPNYEQIIEILNTIDKLDNDEALILPLGFMYEINARIVKKNVRQIKLRRIKSIEEAIENEITLEKVLSEKIGELRDKFRNNNEILTEDYAWINFRGIRDGKNKNYLISDAIEGYLYCNLANEMIKVKRYDTLESLLKLRLPSVPREERAAVRRVIMKIRKRKTLTEKEREKEGFIKKLLLKQAERIVEIPSRSERKFYHIKFRKLPITFPGDNEINKRFYGTWQDLLIEPCCTCDDKRWFITYITPNETWYCVHEIAAYRKLIRDDWHNNKPATGIDAYIAATPFFKPSNQAIRFYNKLKKQVFVKKERYEHLDKVYISVWLMKQIVRGGLDLF